MFMSFVVTISSFMTAVVYYILGQFMIVLNINKCFHLMKSIDNTFFGIGITIAKGLIHPPPVGRGLLNPLNHVDKTKKYFPL